MPLNFTKTLDRVDYSAMADKAILEISPHVDTGKDLKDFKHLITSTQFINQFADEEKGLEQGLWVVFELQNPVPRKDVLEGVETTLFIRQFSTFFPVNKLVRLPELHDPRKNTRDFYSVIGALFGKKKSS